MTTDKPNQESLQRDVFVFPASFAQQRLWFIEQLLPGDALYVIPLIFRLTGVLQRSPFQQSIRAIFQRHEILRTTFDVMDGQLVQAIADDLEIPQQYTDLRALPAVVREDAALNQIWQEIQQPFHLNKGPLFRVCLLQLQDNEHLLLMVLHHIIFDEWSSSVLIRELSELYAAQISEEFIPTTLPQPTAQTNRFPLSFAQQRLWFLYQFTPNVTTQSALTLNPSPKWGEGL